MFFASADQANEWLPFDSSGGEVEATFLDENDKFHEWQLWKESPSGRRLLDEDDEGLVNCSDPYR